MGATLRASLSAIDDADGLSGATFTYQWLADDAEIRDATDSTYGLNAEDEGKTIKVRVIFTDGAGNEETLTSVATSAVAPRRPRSREAGRQEQLPRTERGTGVRT